MKKLIVAAAVLSTPAMAVDFSHYGFVKGSYLSTDKELSSDNKPFWVTDHTGATGYKTEGRSQFSVTQSRWGFKAKHDKITGQFEFDLDGNSTNPNGASSNVASNNGIIRIRQANIGYNVIDGGKLTLGKKWTKFMGVLPHTYSFTKVNFFAGNTGFLVDGLDYTHKIGDLALALEFSNVSNEDDRKASAPITTLNVDYKNDMFRAGAAYTMVKLKHSKVVTTDKDSDASGMKFYGDLTMVKGLSVRAEYYMGKNLKSIQTGALAAAADADAKDYKEMGYFVSAKYSMGNFGVFGGYGSAEFDKKEEAGANALSANTLTHFGLDYKLEKNLTVFAQYEGFNSTWNQATATEQKDSKGRLIDVGLVYKF